MTLTTAGNNTSRIIVLAETALQTAAEFGAVLNDLPNDAAVAALRILSARFRATCDAMSELPARSLEERRAKARVLQGDIVCGRDGQPELLDTGNLDRSLLRDTLLDLATTPRIASLASVVLQADAEYKALLTATPDTPSSPDAETLANLDAISTRHQDALAKLSEEPAKSLADIATKARALGTCLLRYRDGRVTVEEGGSLTASLVADAFRLAA